MINRINENSYNQKTTKSMAPLEWKFLLAKLQHYVGLGVLIFQLNSMWLEDLQLQRSNG